LGGLTCAILKLIRLPAEKVGTVWPRLDHLYEEACKHARGTLTKETVYIRAASGDAQIWIAADETTAIPASCLTSSLTFPGGLAALFVELIAGAKSDIFDLSAALEDYAASRGCHAVYFLMPQKWERHLRSYKTTHILKCKLLFKDVP
jgi:hypothetical protein